ncbi:MAG: hypothetical protein HY720_23790 [Planctomycetes bacterium]|nr:hypothetical protein [Planctomycetota bacterium]
MWILVVIGTAFAGGGVLLGFLSRGYRTKVRRIEETPTSEIRNVRPGLAEIRGRIKAGGEPLASPLSGKPCVYYDFKVEELHRRRSGRRGGSSTQWRTVVRDRQTAPFWVDDGTGQAEVEIEKADLILAADAHARSGFLQDAPPELEGMLRERYGRSSQGLIFNKTMRYSETILEEGDDLFVLGTAVRDAGARPRFVKGDDAFVVSDSDEASVLSSLRSSAMATAILGVVLGLGGVVAAAVGIANL